MVDEGPSPEDVRRFSDDTGYCPECGAEVWDAAPSCSECGAMLPDGPLGRKPVEHEFQRKWIVLVAILLVIAFFVFYVL
jgi:hypothetical protein